MAYVVTDACVKDFVCRDACPTGSIRPEPGEPGAEAASQVFINPDECIDCGSCAGVCAQNAIFPEADLPPEKAQFAEKNRAWFQ